MPDPLRVLLLAGRFEVRASCAYTIRLLESLPEHGVAAEMICSDADKVMPEKRSMLPIREYPRFDRPVWGRVVLESIRRDGQADPPDLIHVQSPSVYASGLWLARQWGRPVVLTVPTSLFSRDRLSEVGGRCRRVIAISRPVADDLIRQNRVPEAFVTVVHSGVDASEPAGDDGVLLPGRRVVVGTAGPLEAAKGLPFFLGAAARVVREYPDCEFLVSGAGPEEHNLRRLARSLGLAGHVTFVSNLYDFATSIDAMDVFCLPSLQQGLGVTMLEAMARGKPVIATGVGGVHSVVKEGRTGLVVPPSDSERLAERVLELLRDPERARQIGEAGRAIVHEQFRVDRMVRETADIYREIVPAGAAAA
ncbi:MAG: glycosyltransferase family 4 protein [Planctomycetaceae bacterium]